jgi:plasmid stabilization system protein ParE
MKTFTVHVLPEFLADLEAIFNWIKRDSPQNAIAVVEAVQQTVSGLNIFPERNPVAYEAESCPGLNIRQALCKNHRIIYHIVKNRVYVLTILNCRQDFCKRIKLEHLGRDNSFS